MKEKKAANDKQTMNKTKPAEPPATRIVLEILLPFLNLDHKTATDEDLHKAVKGIASRLGDGFSEGWFSNAENSSGFLDAWKGNEKALELFRRTLEECRRVILSASMESGFLSAGTTGLSFWGKISEAIKSLEPNAHGFSTRTLGNFVFPRLSYAVKGALKDTFKTQKDFDAVWLPGIRAIILYYVVKAYDLIETGRKGSISPVGYHYIGLCHKEGCGNIFRKTRSNQEFCSIRCKTAQIQRRRREKAP